MRNFQIKSTSTEETQNIASKISSFFKAGDIIILEGNLGAGKTHFVKGFAENLILENDVKSPTFSIANFYKTQEKTEILHIDLYRLSTIEEFINLGLNDYFQNTIVFVEWGKQFSECFDEYIVISLQKGEVDDDRIISFDFENTTNTILKENIINTLTYCK